MAKINLDKYYTSKEIAMNTYGASIGKEVTEIGTFCQENYVVTDWKNLYPFISSPKIQTWKIYKYLKEQIPELN
jgi:hypothetical protein